jgi:hypothetical protein
MKDPKIKMLDMFFVTFSLCIAVSTFRVRKNTKRSFVSFEERNLSFLEIGQGGCQIEKNIQNIMLISDMNENVREKCIEKRQPPIVFSQKIPSLEKKQFLGLTFFCALLIKVSSRS